MPKVSIPRERIADGSLPSICVVCGAEAPHRYFPGIGDRVFSFPMLGVPLFWVYVLFASRSSGGSGLPFCNRHRGYWPRRAWIIVVGFIAVAALSTAGAFLTMPPTHDHNEEVYWLFGVVACWILIFLPVFLVLQQSAPRPRGDWWRWRWTLWWKWTWKDLVLLGASRQFADALKEESE
jgi:hypothetical protein